MALPFHLSSLISCGDVYYLCIPAHKPSWCSMVPHFLCRGVYGLMISLLGIPLTCQNLVTNSTEKSSLVSLVKWSPSIISSVPLHNTHRSFNFKCICLVFWWMLISLVGYEFHGSRNCVCYCSLVGTANEWRHSEYTTDQNRTGQITEIWEKWRHARHPSNRGAETLLKQQRIWVAKIVILWFSTKGSELQNQVCKILEVQCNLWILSLTDFPFAFMI